MAGLRMDTAHQVLEAVARGAQIEAADQSWIDALMTIRWVAQGPQGYVLTPEGLRGLADLVKDHRPNARQRSGALQPAD